MTHPTDEELNTLVTRLDDMSDISRDHAAGLLDLGHKFAVNQAITAITALRAQLAEARVERDNANEIMDDWTTLHRVIADIRDASGLGSRPMLSELACEIGQRISAANARADRAEASLAAQIEEIGFVRLMIDTGWSESDGYRLTYHTSVTMKVLGILDKVMSHDRSALDAMMRAERENAMRDAGAVAYRICAETRHVTLGQKAESAILALIDNPKETK